MCTIGAIRKVTILLAGAFSAAAQQRSVAITIDDGPAVNELKDLENFSGLRGAC